MHVPSNRDGHRLGPLAAPIRRGKKNVERVYRPRGSVMDEVPTCRTNRQRIKHERRDQRPAKSRRQGVRRWAFQRPASGSGLMVPVIAAYRRTTATNKKNAGVKQRNATDVCRRLSSMFRFHSCSPDLGTAHRGKNRERVHTGRRFTESRSTRTSQAKNNWKRIKATIPGLRGPTMRLMN